MPSTYVNMGAQIGDILGKATMGGPQGAAGGVAGFKAGTDYNVANAQIGKMGADTQKIMYELQQAKQADSTSANDIARALGVAPDMIDALSQGRTSMQPMPSDQGPMQPSAADVIPQGVQDKFTNANTLKILQQLTGGSSSGANADTLMSALLKGQDLGTMSNMQLGKQKTGDVAAMQAAMEGKIPGASGGAGSLPTAKVQELQDLENKGIPRERAMGLVYGLPEADAWNKAFTRAYQQTYSVPTAIKAADAAEAKVRESYGSPAPAGPPGKVVKVYN